MKELTLYGDPPVRVQVRRNRRARRMTLRVSGIDGKVTLTIPVFVGNAEARNFAQSRASWVRAQLETLAPPTNVVDGTALPVEGVETLIRIRTGARARHGTDVIEASNAAQVETLLRKMARERLAAATDLHAEALGRAPTALSLRDPRSRWGSCSATGRLMYSWRLILAPPPVLDYVAAHEVAHLKHLDHSAQFWACVEELFPDWREKRAWLRREGGTLHRWQFRH